MEKFDDIIIGSGPAAFMFSQGMQGSQRKIAMIDQGNFGGVCPNVGCEPKIFLEGAVATVLTSRRLQGKGLATPATLDWPTLMARKKVLFGAYPDKAIKNYQASGITTIQGTAKFIDQHTVAVDGRRLQAEHIVIATGQVPNKLPITGSDLTISSNEVFNLDQLPQRVTFIGGGFVSMELAVILNAAGAQVDVIEYAERPLTAFNAPDVQIVVKEMTQQGIRFHFNQQVDQVQRTGAQYQVTTKQGLTVTTDLVVDASGRVPNVAQLNLEQVGVQVDRGGILVDQHLQTTVAGIYAAGDVVSKAPQVAPKLTSTAQFEGEYLSQYLQKTTTAAIQYPVIATAAFTYPQVAQAGMSIATARQDPAYQVVEYPHLAGDDFFYAGTADENAQLTLVFDQTQQLVGISEVSQSAADDVDNFVHLIGLKLRRADFDQRYLPIFPASAYKLRGMIQ
ncbi:dihydrolipoyl dehydrogenase family protein [Levilactobacillus acidifarinae]|uniref:FAD/NAD(P)-binding domain-containing protein n=1 Tax=Levilactobacillus acidifarinae DSM 19394 = JCM 15949 TaxID=1423715 RepID=A0A0R1LF41_9LACO|nr:NAD(P)/FAD-dependent oxidoreductase [Levilactobacillus acidifarinae]KRK94446.1 hypothetical protein FD25_GL000408 [Levilactobacillus acidifarinae DSM 19394]GEO68189.1 glutathione reductase [Levilactobacillus acidifarinae]